MVRGLKGLNYNILIKKISLKIPENLTLTEIEKKIQHPENILLKWFILKINNDHLIIDATYLRKKEV
jgi:hypothetical protein